jgi:catechol 2,3-dioxygenase-like lactoylglutathione lyase family enzyme
MSIRFAHVNLVASDWIRLADFYITVLGCTPVQPKRHLSGEWLERGTGVTAARIEGIHLRLPGHGDHGPTLEIFQYAATEERPATAANRPGFGHIAFQVGSVEEAVAALRSAGGQQLGEIVTSEIAGVGSISFVYATDPEGNIIELQTTR